TDFGGCMAAARGHPAFKVRLRPPGDGAVPHRSRLGPWTLPWRAGQQHKQVVRQPPPTSSALRWSPFDAVSVRGRAMRCGGAALAPRITSDASVETRPLTRALDGGWVRRPVAAGR